MEARQHRKSSSDGGDVDGLFSLMPDSLSNAVPIDGYCGVVACGENACIVCHTLVGVSFDEDGNCEEIGGVGILRIDDRWRGPQHTEATLHEWLHKKHPHWSEEAVDTEAKEITALFHLPEVKRRSFNP